MNDKIPSQRQAFWEILNDAESMVRDGYRRPYPPLPSLSPPRPVMLSPEENTIATTVGDMDDSIKSCRRCRLSRNMTPICGYGAKPTTLLVITPPPDHNAAEHQKPLNQTEESYLNKWLMAIGMAERSYITTIVKCRPPGNRSPFADECRACSTHLRNEIALLKPRALLLLGGVAARALSGREQSLPQLRQQTIRYGSIPAFATYAPADVLKNETELKVLVWHDLQRLRNMLN